MSLKTITTGEAQAGLAVLDSELAFLLETKPKGGLPTAVRAFLGHLGVDSVELFKAIAKDSDDPRRMIHDDCWQLDWGIDITR